VSIPKVLPAGIAAGILGLTVALSPALAATTVVVTQAHPQGWSTADTRPGGTVGYTTDTSADAPLPPGALLLTTDSTNAAKAQYLHAANVPLSSVNELSYYTKQVSASFAGGDPSYQLFVELDGTAGSFTTLVYEPYENGVVTPGAPGPWQKWNVAAGQFWSSRTVNAGGTCVVAAGAGGAPFYTLSALQAACPNAVVIGFGVNIGTYNPSYVVETDGVDFNGTTYNFQTTPLSKDDCKNGGWQNLTDGSGQPFPNQGQCVSYFNHNS
jgi:hypothetical protein